MRTMPGKGLSTQPTALISSNHVPFCTATQRKARTVAA